MGNEAGGSAGSTDGDQIYNWNADASKNSIISHCLIQGGTGGIQGVANHKITTASIITAASAEAVFVSTSNLRLKYGSPAIDQGDNNVIDGADNSWSTQDEDDVALDLDGNVRLLGTKVDLGPYEFGGSGFVERPTITNVTQTTAMFNHYANQAGTVHYVVLEASDTPPADLDELKAADGYASVEHTTKPTSATATSITGLTSKTPYNLYYAFETNSGASTAVKDIAFKESTKLYVNAASTAGSNADGSTWALAYDNLQDALNNSFSGDVLWVAKGTY